MHSPQKLDIAIQHCLQVAALQPKQIEPLNPIRFDF